MHPDKKVGLALGILLIGITGAFFFRNEVPEADDDAQVLADIDKIDQKIRHRSGAPAPYLPERSDRANGSSELTSIPDTSVTGVVPLVPAEAGTDTVPEPLPDPIRPIDEATVDRITPVPKPSADNAGLDAALARTGVGTGRVVSEPLRPSSSTHRKSEAKSTSGDKPGLPNGTATDSRSIAATADPSTEQLYVVLPGDTLSGISERMLGTHRRFRELFEANQGILETPDDLRPGMKLRIPGQAPEAVIKGSVPDHDSLAKRPPSTLSSTPVGSVQSPPTGKKPTEPVEDGPAFVRPSRSPGVLRRRTSKATEDDRPASKSLSQTAPPGVPVVRDFPTGESKTVIATRPGEDTAVSNKSAKK